MEEKWIAARNMLPQEADADAYGCVLGWHVHNGTMAVEYKLVGKNSMISHWQRMPDAPSELARSIDTTLPASVIARKMADICCRCERDATRNITGEICERCSVRVGDRMIMAEYLPK